MLNIHPPLSSFPFALIITTVLIELWLLFQPRRELDITALVTLAAAALGAVLAFMSGYAAMETASQTFQVPSAAVEQHHLYGRLVLFAIIPCLGLKIVSIRARYNQRAFRAVYALFLLLSLTLVIMTGYLGGELVFEYGAGVRAVYER